MNSAKKTLAFLSASAFASSAAHGAILYTPVNLTISTFEALDLDLNQDGAPDFQIQWVFANTAKPYIFQGPSGSADTNAFVLADSSEGLPLTSSGTMIDASYQTAQPDGYFNENGDTNVVGGWTAAGNVEGYVGLELTNATATNFGWAHFLYNASGVPANDVDTGTLTLVDAAMETAPGVGILTGQTAETGPPVVVVQPSSQTGFLGGTAQLSVVAAGYPPPSFQWQKGAVGLGLYHNVSLGANIADATINTDGTMNTLTLQHLTLADRANYIVVVSNSSGSVTSSVPAELNVLPATDSPATLVHRYSFHDPPESSTFADSVGGPAWAGTLEGDAALTGSSLVLDGSSNCFGLLPPDITSNYNQMTVEFWVDIGSTNANPVGPRVFSFGSQADGAKSSGIDYCPYADDNEQNLDFLNTNSDDDYANNAPGLAGTTNDHITVVVDSVHDALYYYNGASVVSTFYNYGTALNQTVVASAAGVPLMSLAAIDDVSNIIGASLNAADPHLAGTIYEFRVYQGVLSPQAVALNDALGPAYYIQLSANATVNSIFSGGNIVLSWPASDLNFAVQASPVLGSGATWTTLTNAPVLVGTNWQVSLPSTGTSQFFQLIYNN